MTLRRSTGLRRLSNAEISSSDRARANHTGTQPISTVDGLTAALDGLDEALAEKAQALAIGVAATAEDLGPFESALIGDDLPVKDALISLASNLQSPIGAGEVGTASGLSAQDRADAEEINLLDVIAEVQGRALALKCATGAIAPNNPADDVSESIAEAVSRVYALPAGGTLYIPPGRYLGDIDLSRVTQVFDRRVVVRGSGMGATTFYPSGSGSIMLKMIGVNETVVQDISFKAGDAYAADAAIFICRSIESPIANGNSFINVDVSGNFNYHGVVACGAETTRWVNCVFRISFSANIASCFWAGTTPSESGVTPSYAGTLTAGPATSNTMFGCKSYGVIDGMRHLTFSQSAGYMIFAHEFIGGSQNNQQLVRIESNDLTSAGGVFNGPIELIGCHFEVFGTGNAGIYIAGNGVQTIYDVHIKGGHVVVDDNFVMVDFHRNQSLGGAGAFFQHSSFYSPAGASGAGSAPVPLYLWAINNSDINWRNRSNNAEVVVFAFAAASRVIGDNLAIGSLAQSDVSQWSDNIPSSGTFARGQRVRRSYSAAGVAAGQASEWIAFAAGTAGTLNGGATTASTVNGSRDVTFSNATGLKVGQWLSIGGNDYRLASISGTSGRLGSAYIGTTASAAAVSFTATGFSTVGVINLDRATAVADLSGAATLADVVNKINEMLASDRAANQRAN
ncbi:MAG: hypothetical protein A2792_03470 [Sphingomonadales bacterium RIFCSPHIGHO2_01_FULL_65_20]|nr:MAG: hypothetical protein A2792_03470 [Sphingomonadales bacterium RIFCSPHIGHO2_01_FULL_65_20]